MAGERGKGGPKRVRGDQAAVSTLVQVSALPEDGEADAPTQLLGSKEELDRRLRALQEGADGPTARAPAAGDPDAKTELHPRGGDPDAATEAHPLHGAATGLSAAVAPHRRARGGEHIGRFELRGELGAGGSGRVVLAWDSSLDREVAIKLIQLPRSSSGEVLEQALAEARITARLDHPTIVPVYEIGLTDDAEVYLVMKRVVGRPLSELLLALQRGDSEAVERWPPRRLLGAFVRICQAAAFAHDRGVLHRDLKPSNVLLGGFGEVHVLDWGVARLREAAGLSDEGEELTIGTAGYMSPEQCRSEWGTLDRRSDVWSLGAILFELLTLRRAYPARSLLEATFRVVENRPPDPREVPGGPAVPDELAEACLKALAVEPRARFASAAELGAAVESYLSGARRKAEAVAALRLAEEAWARYQELLRRRGEVDRLEAEAARRVPPWTPLAEKGELLALREEQEELGPALEDAFEAVVLACDRARLRDPDDARARELLAEAYFQRLELAEARGDSAAARHFARRVEACDPPWRVARLAGLGAVTLRTDPAGAEVLCRRVEQRGLVWEAGEPQRLGRTPIERAPLAMGSYLLTVRARGRAEVVYPVRIDRGRHWEADGPLRLLSHAELGRGWVFVPGGPFLAGGDPEAPASLPAGEHHLPSFLAAVFPVTMGEYCDFINALHREDPEEAWRRVPRQDSGRIESAGQYWRRPRRGERYEVPEVDHDGDRWSPLWPALGLSWDDAVAYCGWRSGRDGVPYRLPTELEWEKAVRGVDGRRYPWGSRFDATLCCMRDSRPGPPKPQPVGSFRGDRSVYGLRDAAGSIRNWCGDARVDGDADRRMVRGASWQDTEREVPAAARFSRARWRTNTAFGFRLVRDLPGG